MKRTPLRPANRKRLQRLRAEAFGGEGEQADRCRKSVCLVCMLSGTWQTTRTEASHHKTRGAGGKIDQCLPLCSDHHAELGWRGVVTFWAKYRIDPLMWLERMREPGAVVTESEAVPF